jgi:hypothetical protein
MKLDLIAAKLSLAPAYPDADLGREVTGGYASDLLSDVMGNAREGQLWITLQVHVNTIAVASLKGLAGVVVVGGRKPEEATLARAAAEGVPVLLTALPAFEIAGRLYSLGLRCP